MGFFDKFQAALTKPAVMPGDGVQQPGIPPTGPPPDDSGEWEWDGSAWVRRRDPNPTQPGNPGYPGPTPPPAPPPSSTPPASTGPGAPAGWDPTKWANQQHQTDKYKAGRILAKYPPTVEGLKQAIPELQAAYPGLTFNGKDTIEIPGLGPIDVLQGASNGGVAWQWIDKNWEAKNGGGATGNTGVPPMPGVQPTGPGPVGGYTPPTHETGSTGWQMPKGSDYQFGGIPGYSGGAFNVPGSTSQTQPSSTGMINPVTATTDPTRTRGGMDTGLPPTDPMGVATMGQAGAVTATTDPNRSRGVMTQPGGQTHTGSITSTGSQSTTQPGGGYDRAPGFTPLDPFKAPPSPDAAAPWKGTAFDVGEGAEKFNLPSWEEVMKEDPGIQFGIEQGRMQREQSAAAKGILRSGGTLKGIDEYAQKAATQGYGDAVNRKMAAAGFNENNRRGQLDLGLRANQQNNAFDLEGSKWNADQTQRKYDNEYQAANQGYSYAADQNKAGNAQAMTGYQTDVSRMLAEKGINLTASQNAAVNSLNAQQQYWMQDYMSKGASFDQAYRMLMAKLQYPSA